MLQHCMGHLVVWHSSGEAFLAEIKARTDIDVDPSHLRVSVATAKSQASGGASAGASASSAGQPWQPDTVEQMKSKTYQAQKVGIKVGAFVTQKKATTVKIFKVTSISDADGANVEFEGVATKVPVAELLDAWRVHKGKVSEMVEFETPLPHELEAWGMEAVKGAIAIAIRNEFAKNTSTMKLIQVFANPTTVKAARNLTPNELQLVAASQRVDKKHAETSIPLGEFNVSPENRMELFLLPHFVPPTSSTGEANKAPFNSPFGV